MLRELRWPIAAALIIAAAAAGPTFAVEAAVWLRTQLEAPSPVDENMDERGAVEAQPAEREGDAARRGQTAPVDA